MRYRSMVTVLVGLLLSGALSRQLRRLIGEGEGGEGKKGWG